MLSRSRQPANIPYSNFWLVAAEDAVRPRASENRKNYANAVGSKEKRSKRCIMTVRYLVDRIGAGNIFVGTDLPFDMASPSPIATLSTAVGETQTKLIAETNPAVRFGFS